MKRLAVALLAMVAACGPNYQDGKTKCASDGTCPDGFICGSKAPDLDLCFELSKRPQCTAGQYLCSSGACVASKDLCPQLLGGSMGGGGGMSTVGIGGAGGTTGGMTNPIGGATSSLGGTTGPSGGAITSGGTVITMGGITAVGGVTTVGGITVGGVTTVGGITVGGVTSVGGVVIGGVTTKTGGVTTSTGGATTLGGVTTSTGGVTGGVMTTGGVTTVGGKTASTAIGHYQMENLDRGLVAVVVTNGVYVGWRMLGYEYTGTDSDTSYNLYRNGAKLINVTDSTNYLDAAGTSASSYAVSAVLKGVEGTRSAAVTPWSQQYLSIPITPPPAGINGGSYSGSTFGASDGSPGDLDGDGNLDIVLKWDPSNLKDNSESGTTDDVFLDGYTLDGMRLWRIDLGPNIRAGAHYTQFSVYDFDGDGKAEVACKTAPGTKDGTGAYLSTRPAASDDDSAVYRNASGYILTGPEYLTVFAGETGRELATIDYPVLRGTVGDWGDSYGNRVDRFNGGMAFAKDFPAGGGAAVANGRPSIIQQRGYYTRTTVSALTYRNGVLATNWVFDYPGCYGGGTLPIGCGDHSCMAADVDGDGAQEIVPGAITISSDGKFMCDSGMGHGDAMDVGSLVPGKGIAVFSIHESLGGMDAHDGATCASYFAVTEPSVGSNRGRAEYVGPGNETSATCYCSGCTEHIALCADGTTSVTVSPGANFVIYWDDDEWRESENATSITKPSSGAILLNATGCSSNNATKSTPVLTADLLGDWREEIVYRESLNSALRVYTTTTVTARRIYTLMHDPTYRAQVSFEQSAYNQPPHTGFQISPNMPPPPVPNIYVR